MYLRHLSLADFRSWTAADLALAPGPSVLIGANGQGKTNLVEAVHYLATLGSHRVPTDAPLVRMGAERAVVRAAVVADARELRVEVEISPGRANRARLNTTAVRPREILGAVRTVLFAPEDLAVVRGDPAERRRFLDDLVVARSPRMAGVRADYERVLRQRAALLKTAGAARRAAGGPDLSTLDVWDEHLAEYGSQLLAARAVAVADLREPAADAYGQVAPASVALKLDYQSTAEAVAAVLAEAAAADRAPQPSDLRTALLAELQRVRSAELDRGVNLAGPHRDELRLALGDLPVRGYASHGESWSTALALRLGTFDLLRTDHPSGGDPILLLDDVFAELDDGRREQLAVVAAKAEQTLVTAAVPSDVPAALASTRFTIEAGAVRSG